MESKNGEWRIKIENGEWKMENLEYSDAILHSKL